MNNRTNKITILIPCHNEEASIGALYDELLHLMDENKHYLWEILFVNDGSSDNTLSVIKELREQDERVSYVDLSRNFGKECAMLAGFDYATGDAIVIMDADLQHPPSVVPQMVAKWEEGYDDVYGKRMNRGNESWIKRQISSLFYYMLQKSSRYDILPNVGDFRLLDRKCIRALCALRESERYTKGMFAWIGFRKTYVPFETQKRYGGQTSWGVFDLIQLAIDGLTSSTTFPLRLSTIVGLIISGAAFIYIIYIFVRTLLVGDPVAGHPTLIITVMLMGGVNLISLGVIGEYIGRIFIETKNRPTYIATSYNGKDV